MSFPALSKTWQVDANNVLGANNTNVIMWQMILNEIKNELKGFSTSPWTVQYSSNAGNNGAAGAASGAAGAAGDLVDRWVVADQASGANSTNDVNCAAAGSRHSWTVLRQTGIASNYELCIDCSNSTGGLGTIVFSPSAGFTGGTATARPTATDETVVISNTTVMTFPSANSRYIVHSWLSTDGQCTRVMVMTSGQSNPLYFQMDKVQSPSSGWTTPSICVCVQGATATNLASGTNVKMRGGGGTPNFAGSFTEERWNNAARLATTALIGTAPNSFSLEWPVLPMGVAANGATNSGRLGNIYDMWWCPVGVNPGDTAGSDVTNRTHVAMNGCIFPWTGDSTVPLLA